jgi:hypothetical protein
VWQELQSSPLKLYIESEEPVDARPRNYFDKQATKIISRPEIAQRVTVMCNGTCAVTIKKDAADFVLMFAAGQGSGSKNWVWTAYENEGGLAIGTGETMWFDNAIKDAFTTVYNTFRDKRCYELGICKRVGTPMGELPPGAIVRPH